MEKSYRKLFFLLAALPVLLAACAKGGSTADDDNDGVHTPTPTDTTPPVITINAPLANQAFGSGTAINISGNISDDYGLYQGFIKVVNDANGLELVRQPYVIHGIKSYNYNFSYTPSVSSASDYTITVSFEDHGYNVANKSVKVKVNP
jgi:phosphate-selective porin